MRQVNVRRLTAAAAATFALAAIAFPATADAQTTAASAHTSQACGAWKIVNSPDKGANGSSLSGVSATSASDAWAVGSYFTGSIYQTLAEHWNGTKWSIVKTPVVGTFTNALTSVVAISPTDAWAVGFYSDTTTFRTLALHWNGTRWKLVSTPNSGAAQNQLFSVSAVNSHDVWAVGLRQDSSSAPRLTLTEHWNGSNWSVVSSPNVGTGENFLFSVAARTSGDVWAVGTYSVPWLQNLTEHWNGSSWSVVKSPDRGDGNNSLYGVVALKANRAYAVGTWLDASSNTKALSLKWNGSKWSNVPMPSPVALLDWPNSIAAASESDMWAVGWAGAPFANTTLAEHFDGSTWTVEATPNVGTGSNQLNADALVPGGAKYWAVGHYEQGGNDHTLVESRC